MTVAARRRDVRAKHAAARIALPPDLVVTVAIRALGRHEEAALLERLSVDAVVVLGEHVADLDAAVLDDLGVAVARPAHRREVQRIRPRFRIVAGPDVVRPVAIDAPRGARVPGLPRFRVDAFPVGGDRIGVTRRAVHRLELLGMGKLGVR